ncbi:MAG: tyrosine--tRNA ligase [Candidatus Spechtbacterales bacterium]
MPLNSEQINGLKEALGRWVEEAIPSQAGLGEALIYGKKLTIYHGVDPTAPDLHLGHSTNYFLLRRLQKLGHRIILLIGDFTARIGDPSGRTIERTPLTEKQVTENAKTYKKQVAKILDFDSAQNPVSLAHNSKWLGKLALNDIIDISSRFTVQQMLARDMFQKRIKDGNPIGLHEFLYPLMQGYDSVALKTDVEVGGSDQLFNMLVGRDLVKKYLAKEKFVITTKLLVNPKTGVKLMSKSEGNYIALNDLPDKMYGKVMALPDEVINDCFELCTEVPMGEIAEIIKTPPREAKARLAREIVEIYHGKSAAESSQREFERVFTSHEAPQNIEEIKLSEKNLNIVDLLVKIGFASSKNEARRLIEQGGVRVGGAIIKDWNGTVKIEDKMIVQVGKRRFARLALH